jgi:nucleotide-binding universal stress UspA family protein
MEPFAPQRILAATDFSEVSIGALCHAASWAQRFRAELVVLHSQEFLPITLDPLASYALPLGSCAEELQEAAREAATQQLGEAVRQYVPADVRVSRELLCGAPAEVIQEYAAAQNVGLVVLGTHGRKGIGRLLLGSVAERILRVARYPTLIIRPFPAQDVPEAAAPRVSHILCPVNYSEVARAAFEHASAVARAFAARLTAVFTVEQEHPTAENLQGAEDRLRAWLHAESAAECRIQAVVRHGDAGEQVISIAREAAVDLVVIGAQHRRFADTTVLGVTTVRVTRHAPCPVLVVPRFGGA